jgi:hypothetical protein
MKVLVLGSLLLQTLNAQILTDIGDATATALDTPAPLLTPGADLGAAADPAALPADFDGLEFPTGTADVIVETSPTPLFSDDVSSVDDAFGGGETPGAGIELGDLSEFDFPTSTLAPEATLPSASAAESEAPLPKTLVGDPVRNDFDAPSSTSPDEFGLGTPATASETPALPSTLVDALQASAGEFDDLPTTADDFAEPTDAATTADSFALPMITGTGSAEPGFGGASAPDDGSASSGNDLSAAAGDDLSAPEGDGSAVPEDDGSAVPEDDGPTMPEDDGSTAPDTVIGDTLNGFEAMESPSPDDTVSSATPTPTIADESPWSWNGGDTTQYAGQDYGYDDECPWYCQEDGDGYDNEDGGDEDAGDEDEVDDDAPYFMSLLNRLRRRQNVPSSNGGFSALRWPGAGKEPHGGEDCEDLPSWLYEQTGKKPKPCKKSCPASCYTTTPSPEESPVESSTRSRYHWHPHSTPEPYPKPSTSDYYEPNPTPDTSSPDSAESSIVDDSYSYDSTTTATQTTLVTQVVTESSPYETGSAGYIGNTLDSVCPKQCNPLDPLANKCDITSSCTTTGEGKYYCACRAGYMSSEFNAKDFSKQFKLTKEDRVYGAESMVCDKVCDDIYCSEVLVRPQCG